MLKPTRSCKQVRPLANISGTAGLLRLLLAVTTLHSRSTACETHGFTWECILPSLASHSAAADCRHEHMWCHDGAASFLQTETGCAAALKAGALIAGLCQQVSSCGPGRQRAQQADTRHGHQAEGEQAMTPLASSRLHYAACRPVLPAPELHQHKPAYRQLCTHS